MVAEYQSFENDLFYAAIRSALSLGNATVMIGAGFSRNAHGGEQLSTWPDLAVELAKKLDPKSVNKTFSTTAVSQLAEQFAQVFSKPALEELLKRMIPDDKVIPGKLHDELLSLPWSEIFTTNYDTLLERAAEKKFERPHFTICCREDIPQSKLLGRRRIVKLHGSFPSQRPFIFTEEDYRTYPEKFSPFVNLVRQSLLENVFCLIGFSGDDPNFLCWLGWVRDMLDRHSLPVYLFLSHPPSLGERSLLQARGVTPVVLPDATTGDPHDYTGRYAQLFRLLSQPLVEKPEEWGRIEWPQESSRFFKEDKKRYEQFLSFFPTLASLQKTYPGWIVAPRSVRARLNRTTRSLQHSVDSTWLLKELQKDSPVIALAVLSLHAWCQEVELAPLDDHVASVAVSVLSECAKIEFQEIQQGDRTRLKEYHIEDDKALNRSWTTLLLSTLRWARQGLRDGIFNKLCELAISHTSFDGAIKDAIKYESILLQLYRGERIEAKEALDTWSINSADRFYLVRKASLAAELGNPQQALLLCEEAISHLRESQKTRPQDPFLSSQEAWACLLAERLHQALNHLRNYFPLKQDEQSNPEDSGKVTELSERLRVLAVRGYAASDEIDAALAALNAEAEPPFVSKYKFGEFDLGSYSSTIRFGQSLEFQAKIEAALSWLDLSERVGLLARTKNISFYAEAFMQAAWWAQYADTSTRVLSVLIRSMKTEALKPKDDSVPPHKTGWLSRYQVATVPLDVATDMCQRLLYQAQILLTDRKDPDDFEITVNFYLEIYSRLVLRVEHSSLISQWGRQLVDMHRLKRLHENPSVWRSLAKGLARTVEALPSDLQCVLVRSSATLPYKPPISVPDHMVQDWVQPFSLLEHLNPSGSMPPADWRVEIDAALTDLCTPASRSRELWHRLTWLKKLGVLNEDDEQKVSRTIWSYQETLPILPGLKEHAAVLWSKGIDKNADEIFLSWLLNGHLSRISKAGDDILGFPLSSDESYISNWRFALTRSAWNLKHIQAFFEKVAAWWQEDGSDVAARAASSPELQEILLRRVSGIDYVFAEGLTFANQRFGEGAKDLISQVFHFATELRTRRISLPRVSALMAMIEDDAILFESNLHELAESLFDGTEGSSASTAASVYWIVKHIGNWPEANFDILLDGLTSLALARRTPGLSHVLKMLTNFLESSGHLVKIRHLKSCDTALSYLSTELRYEKRAEGTNITDQEVPLLRFLCAQLANALNRDERAELPKAKEWLEQARHDPLPELRFGRFRFESL